MSFLDNLTKKVGDAAKTAAKKSEGFVETTKLNMAISSDEGRIKAIYTQIGELVYRRFKSGSEQDEELSGFCDQIKEIEDNIVSLKDKIEQIKAGTEQVPSQSAPPTAESQPQYAPCSQPVQQSEDTPQTPHPEQSFIPVAYTNEPGEQAPQESEPQYIPVSQHVQTEPAPPAQKAFCPTCGSQVAPGGRFCTSCGTKL